MAQRSWPDLYRWAASDGSYPPSEAQHDGLSFAPGNCSVTARTVQGMARVRSGQAPAWPLSSDRSVRRGSSVKRDFACTFTGHLSPVLVVLRSQSRLRLEGRTRTLSGPSPDLSPTRTLAPSGLHADHALSLQAALSAWEAALNLRLAAGTRVSWCPLGTAVDRLAPWLIARQLHGDLIPPISNCSAVACSTSHHPTGPALSRRFCITESASCHSAPG